LCYDIGFVVELWPSCSNKLFFTNYFLIFSFSHPQTNPSTRTGLAVVTGLRYPSRVATQMLTETYTDYIPALGEKAKSALPNSLNKASKPILTRFCQKYSDVQSVDKASALIGKVEGVKVQMQDNIASMLQNMEKTEDISDQANHLNEQASVFKKKSTDLKRHMKCKNLKMTLIIAGLILGILLIILVPMIQKAKKASSEKDD
jgi:vesicle-associated membrane protein 7